MGNCCKSEKKLLDGGDVPIPTNLGSIKNPLIKYEKKFPFHRMNISTMRYIIHSFLDNKGKL